MTVCLLLYIMDPIHIVSYPLTGLPAETAGASGARDRGSGEASPSRGQWSAPHWYQHDQPQGTCPSCIFCSLYPVFTATRLRKYYGTTSQILALTDSDFEVLTKHMGHDKTFIANIIASQIRRWNSLKQRS